MVATSGGLWRSEVVSLGPAPPSGVAPLIVVGGSGPVMGFIGLGGNGHGSTFSLGGGGRGSCFILLGGGGCGYRFCVGFGGVRPLGCCALMEFLTLQRQH